MNCMVLLLWFISAHLRCTFRCVSCITFSLFFAFLRLSFFKLLASSNLLYSFFFLQNLCRFALLGPIYIFSVLSFFAFLFIISLQLSFCSCFGLSSSILGKFQDFIIFISVKIQYTSKIIFLPHLRTFSSHINRLFSDALFLSLFPSFAFSTIWNIPQSFNFYHYKTQANQYYQPLIFPSVLPISSSFLPAVDYTTLFHILSIPACSVDEFNFILQFVIFIYETITLYICYPRLFMIDLLSNAYSLWFYCIEQLIFSSFSDVQLQHLAFFVAFTFIT